MKPSQNKIWKSFVKKFLKSKTMLLSLLIATLGILELNLHLFYDVLGEYYGVVFLVISLASAYIRLLTTKPFEDK